MTISYKLKLAPTYHRDTYPSISPTKPSLTQTGKTILITGGGDGIGLEIARSFAKARASRIIIVGRRAGLLDEAVRKLRDEFQSGGTEFMAHQTDIGSDTSISSLWEFLHSQNILVHVIVFNATHMIPNPPDTLSTAKNELMDAFNVNVGGNFVMAANFVKQALRPAGTQLFLVNISTLAIHTTVPTMASYGVSKAAFTGLLGRIANDCPAEDVQIISFHPGALYSEGASKILDKDTLDWDEFALPADFSVWAASPEAAWLHGRFVWAHWDVDELRSDPEVLKRLEEEKGYLMVGVQGLTAATIEPMSDAKKN
ncbi:short-chain dehydrogenase/reductase [Gymnopus androsaceus JB14]|uniref:Short-chain dehydrogenase/reductase n=1 Tax=Gymnopus androsaceus JB14 TaxID=1447944 RepID=A0A6A4HVP1_9AGAR|nr:short-chain dehydrogenase/reductase [Gymnopus androsaceus JB14]